MNIAVDNTKNVRLLTLAVMCNVVSCAEFTSSPVAASRPTSESGAASREALASSQPSSRVTQTPTPTDTKGADPAVTQAQALLAEGNRREAENVLLAARKAQGNQPAILLALAAVARLDKRFADSRELARKVLLRDQANTEAISLVALSYVDEKKLDLAEVYCSTALRRVPANQPNSGAQSSQLLATLAFVYYKRGDTQKAVNTFRRATDADAGNATAHADLGLIALSFRDYALAKSELDKAASLGRTDKSVSAGRCYALEGLHVVKDASSCLQDLIAKLPPSDPDLAGYLYSLGVIATTMHDRAAALTAFHRYVELKGAAMNKKDRVFDLIHRLEADDGKPRSSSPPGSANAGGHVPMG